MVLNGCQDTLTLELAHGLRGPRNPNTLRRLPATVVSATLPVHALSDQGLGSRDLWAQIVALGWYPYLRYQPHVTFQPEGQAQRVPAS